MSVEDASEKHALPQPELKEQVGVAAGAGTLAERIAKRRLEEQPALSERALRILEDPRLQRTSALR